MRSIDEAKLSDQVVTARDQAVLPSQLVPLHSGRLQKREVTNRWPDHHPGWHVIFRQNDAR